MQDFEIIFYQLPDGTEPVRDFLLGLDIKMRAKLMHNMEILQQQGINAREPYSKPIEDGIFEIRVQTDGNISSVLDFFFVGRKIVLTNLFIKKTQKTPRKEIDMAKAYRNEYLKRMEV